MVEKRRARKKSRSGCRNCKLRKVKCDETKPQCKRCCSYGAVCNYGFTVTDLQSAKEEPPVWQIPSHESPSQPPATERSLASTQSLGPLASRFDLTLLPPELDADAISLLNRFLSRTVHSLGGAPYVEIFEKHMFKETCRYPFLMHGILAITAVHDRFLTMSASGRRSVTEVHHASQCATLFNQKLSTPPKPEDRDPLWATAALIGALAVASTDAATPEESWPLKPPEPADLEWLNYSEGKMAVWELADPLRPGGIFRKMESVYAEISRPLPLKGTEGVSPELIRLCRLSQSSTRENNPYHGAVHYVSRLLRLRDEQVTMEQSLGMVSHMQQPFRELLQEKDPVALLLLFLWYTKARVGIWWIELRARVEAPAIYMYLKRHHMEDPAVQSFLP